ncbi:hypothetical protein NUW58_g9602 [Xylaria curta]|uniref:Uncharacterized protein n=1 Tax=Xylaria curta TaxID=42375 RepID=A0ACC1MWJ9_9PEZI|nr:hypothetical protein NUW58_g9602 [Xylaria curta]
MANPDLLDPRLRSPRIAAPSLSHTKGRVEDEDESEWEYEYSATETETFYVTLDLSKADFRAQEQSKNQGFPSREGGQTQRSSELFLNGRKATTDRASHNNSAASSIASSDAERDDEDRPEVPRDDRGKQRSNAEDEDEEGANRERVQILELHSENPIISYKGRVFSGRWCENTTTELLMTRGDEDSSLPILRHLEDGVDLLAASSSRITVTEQKFKPKASQRDHQRSSAYLPQTIIPPVDPKASQERTDQRNFLADLIALKRRKGETDDVTRLKYIAVAAGLTRISCMPFAALRGSRVAAAGKKGSGRARGKWALFPLEELAQDPTSVASSGVNSPGDGESGISTPTPSRWDDLEEGQDGSPSPARMERLIEVDMEVEQDEDEADYDDNNDYDEDEEDDQGDMDEDED